MLNVMLDLETMDTKPTAAITEIGAVRFDNEKILSRFRIKVDLQSCIDLGLTVSGSTIMWCLK